jgi:hypothetical protein
MCLDSKSDIYIGGDAASDFCAPDPSGYNHALLMKFSPTGNLLWGKQFGAYGCATSVGNLCISNEGDVIVTGTSGQTDDDTTSFGFVSDFDSGGGQKWYSKGRSDGGSYGSPIVLAEGSILVSTYNDIPGTSDTQSGIIKYSGGVKQWEFKATGTAGGSIYGVCHRGATITVLGMTRGDLYGKNLGDYDGFIAQYKEN